MKMILKLCAAMVIGAATLAAADVVVLQSGEKLEGDLKKSPEGWTLRLHNGATMELPVGQVKSVQLMPRDGASAGGEGVAQSRLDSLNKSMAAATDAQSAIDRYQAFVEQYKTSPVAEDAKKELAIWRERLDKGLMKQGEQWITPKQALELRNQSTAQAAEARALLKAGRMTDAQPLIDTALKNDPTNISALYLRGVLAYQADQINDARRAWEAVAGRIKDHAPTLNNLAVIGWRQNRHLDALNLYDQAMTAAPADEIIIANVAEALNALPANLRDGAVARRAYRKYTEQDQVVSKAMAERGLYRWGNQYIAKEEFDRLEAQRKAVQDQLDQLAGRFKQAEDAIRDLDIKGEQNDRTLRQIEAGRNQRTIDGDLILLPLPPVYFEIQQDNVRLKQQRDGAVRELDGLRKTAAQLQQQIPQPKYTGVQKIIGIEATPAAVEVQPTTDPSK